MDLVMYPEIYHIYHTDSAKLAALLKLHHDPHTSWLI